MVKYGISEYNTSYGETVEGSEEIIVTQPSYLICYDEAHFQLTQKVIRTNTNVERTLHVSENETGEVFPSWYECNCTAVVGFNATGEPLPLVLI